MRSIVTGRGQVTIPKAIRDHLGITSGMKVTFSLDSVGRVFIDTETSGRMLNVRFERLRGTATIGLSTDEIMALTRGDTISAN